MASYESVPSPGYRADREAPACGDNCDDVLGAPVPPPGAAWLPLL